MFSEFLIGPRHANGVLATHHGDSGSVWCLDFGKEYPPMPLAVQWGGHEFTSMSGKEENAIRSGQLPNNSMPASRCRNRCPT